VVVRRGLRTTSIERTLLDLAAIGEPIGRLVAEATAKRLTSIAKLRTYVERRSGARGVARLRSCIEGRETRSAAEAVFAAWLEERRIPVPPFNVEYGPFTLDGLWEAAGSSLRSTPSTPMAPSIRSRTTAAATPTPRAAGYARSAWHPSAGATTRSRLSAISGARCDMA